MILIRVFEKKKHPPKCMDRKLDKTRQNKQKSSPSMSMYIPPIVLSSRTKQANDPTGPKRADPNRTVTLHTLPAISQLPDPLIPPPGISVRFNGRLIATPMLLLTTPLLFPRATQFLIIRRLMRQLRKRILRIRHWNRIRRHVMLLIRMLG